MRKGGLFCFFGFCFSLRGFLRGDLQCGKRISFSFFVFVFLPRGRGELQRKGDEGNRGGWEVMME